MTKIPSSLKWLIDKRGRVAGEIKKIEAALAKCQSLATDLEKLKNLLDSVDQTLTLHEIRVDPDNIPTIRSKDVRINLPHGELTRSVLLCLKLNKPHPVSTVRIASFIADRHASLQEEQTDFSRLQDSIRYCLRALKRKGIVTPHHIKKGSVGFWSIVD